ncbi:Sbal_3080 family lipoprotein [Sulfurimonas sp.]
MKKSLYILVSALVVLFSGCSTKKMQSSVEQINAEHKLEHICIEDNLRFQVNGFIKGVSEIFNEYGITTETYKADNKPESCNTIMTLASNYSANVKAYMNDAELKLYENKEQIGYAQYISDADGMIDYNKFDTVKNKISPVVEDLLDQYEKREITPKEEVKNTEIETVEKMEDTSIEHESDDTVNTMVSQEQETMVTNTLEEKLTQIKKFHKNGLITQEEYDNKRQQLLENY